jgi:hypothetical protein
MKGQGNQGMLKFKIKCICKLNYSNDIIGTVCNNTKRPDVSFGSVLYDFMRTIEVVSYYEIHIMTFGSDS